MAKRVLIVGGVAGGAGAAARMRRLDEDVQVILFERGEYISFANCGLPYYIGDVIRERKKLLVQTKKAMEERFNIEVRTKSEVLSINRDKKEVEVRSGGETYRESYDYLILSPGAEPVNLSIPGSDKTGIFALRNMADVDRIKEFVNEKKPETAVVVGAGYIGIEMAENLREIGTHVTVVEAAGQVLGPLDVEMSKILEKNLIDHDVKLVLNDSVTSFSGDEPITVSLKSGRELTADIVIMAAGVKPEVKLAREAGLKIGERGGISVDDYLKTSDPYIYAVGDAIEVRDIVNGGFALIPLAGPANKQARIAADNICGRKVKFRGSQGTSIVKVFDLTAAATGNNEKMLKRQNIPYIKSFTQSGSHAGYYPGARVMTVKLLFSTEDGRVLGAQIVGPKGVDKRIDVLAAAVRQGMTVYDLEELELAYAPPYSSAKDPVNMAGFVAANILKGDMKVKHWDELEEINPEEYFILDARTELEYANGHYPGAVNIPLDSLRGRLGEIPSQKKILVYCKIGLRAYLACRILMQNGFDAYNLSGGYDLFLAQSYQSKDTLNLNEQMTCFEEKKTEKTGFESKTIKIDACGLQCPGPIMMVNQEIAKIGAGEILEVHTTDPAFTADISAWCMRTGNKLVNAKKTAEGSVAFIMKGSPENGQCNADEGAKDDNGKSIIVFSGDLDKAIASFIIANGGAAMGRKVTMFFTFWGLNVLRRDVAAEVNKTFIEKMFAMMMPRGSRRLGLSRMNMGGMGARMIRGVMKNKNIASLEELIGQAKAQGVKLVACSMSMDVMGIKKEELIDGVEIGGVASYLAEAEQSDVNLFI